MVVLSKLSEVTFVDPTAATNPYVDDEFEFTRIAELEKRETGAQFNKMLFCMVVYHKLSNAHEQTAGVSWNTKSMKGGSGGSIQYTRMLVAMDVFSSVPGANLVTFLFGREQNEVFYEQNLDLRNNGAFGKYECFGNIVDTYDRMLSNHGPFIILFPSSWIFVCD